MKPANVSVVIPTYNRPAYLEQAVGSVLAQTVRPLEILVVDDGSADEHRREIDRISARHPAIALHRFPANRGRSAARNEGLAAARGEFLVFLDDDDLLHPRYLESSLAHFQNDPAAGAVFCRGRFFGHRGPYTPLRLGVLLFECGGVDSERLRPFLSRSLLDMIDPHSNPAASILMSSFPINSVLVRKGALNGAAFPPDMSLGEDLHFLLSLAARGCRFRRNPEILAFIRYHPQDTGNNGNLSIDRYLQLAQRLRADNLIPGMENRFLASVGLFLKRVKKGDRGALKDFIGLLRFPGLFCKFSYLYLVALCVHRHDGPADPGAGAIPEFPGWDERLAGQR